MTALPSMSWRRLSRTSWVLLGFALSVLTLLLIFDWNWLRGPLVRHLADTSGREVRIDDLQVEWGLAPVVRLRGVYIENAPWASKQPLITAGEMSFSVSLASIWRRRPIISRLVLVDAKVDMERRADGLRNWRLRKPGDRAPGRVVVTTLEAHRSELRFVNQQLDLDFTARASPANAATAGAQSTADAHPTRIAFEGRYQGRDFTGEARSGVVISFRESGLSFPLQGHIVSRNTRLELDGVFTDVFDLHRIEARLRLTGPTLALLHPFVRVRPAESRPYVVDAQLTQANNIYRFTQLVGKIGATHLSADITYDRSSERPRVEAKLHSDAAQLDDLRPLFGMPSANRPARNPRSNTHANSERDSKPALTSPARASAMRTVDVRLTSSLKKLAVDGFGVLENVALEATLQDGLLELKPFNAQVAGGKITGAVTLDRRSPDAAGTLVGELRGIRIERLLPKLSAKSDTAGALNVQVKLSGRGDGLAAMLENAAGSFAATMEGGRISNLADAKLGLNFGKMLRTLVRGDSAIAINCGAFDFDVRAGVAKSRRIVLDTEQTHVEGAGSINLIKQQLDFLLTPEPKNPGLFMRRASVRVRGAWRSPAISIEERVEQAVKAEGRC